MWRRKNCTHEYRKRKNTFSCKTFEYLPALLKVFGKIFGKCFHIHTVHGILIYMAITCARLLESEASFVVLVDVVECGNSKIIFLLFAFEILLLELLLLI